MMNADQLRARANFYREMAVVAERDRDFALNLELARTFDRIAQDVRHWEAACGRAPGRHEGSLDRLCRFMRLRNRCQRPNATDTAVPFDGPAPTNENPRNAWWLLSNWLFLERSMKSCLTIGCVTACLMLGACQTAAERVSDKEDLLAAAGFTVRPANSPQRLTAMRQLPANKFVQKVNGDQVEYVYADPVVCNCLYIGDQKSYGAYKQEIFTRNIVNEQQLNAEVYQDRWEWGGWDWGPWGPGEGW